MKFMVVVAATGGVPTMMSLPNREDQSLEEKKEHEVLVFRRAPGELAPRRARSRGPAGGGERVRLRAVPRGSRDRKMISRSVEHELDRLRGVQDALREVRRDRERVADKPPPLAGCGLASTSLVGTAFPWATVMCAVTAGACAGRHVRPLGLGRVSVAVASIACGAGFTWIMRKGTEWLAAWLFRRVEQGAGQPSDGLHCRPSTWTEIAASMALGLKNGFNTAFSEKIRWLNIGSFNCGSARDHRAPFHRGTKMEDDEVSAHRFVAIAPFSFLTSEVLAVPEIVSQVVIRMNCCDHTTSIKNGHTLASRITMMNIGKQWTADVVYGSAALARALTSHRFARDRWELGVASSALCFGGILGILAGAPLPGSIIVSGSQLDIKMSLGMAYEMVLDVFIAPYMEETIKQLLYSLGLCHASKLFGLAEYAIRIGPQGLSPWKSLPALGMHAAVCGLPFTTRVLCHQNFNLAIWAMRLLSLTSLGTASGTAAAGVLALAVGGLSAAMRSRRVKSRAESGTEPVTTCFGYRFGDRLVPWTPELAHEDVRVIRQPSFYEDTPRAAMMVSLGPVLEGLCPPVPDRNHFPSVLHGVLNRFCSDPPRAQKLLLREFADFVSAEVSKLQPVEPDADTSEENWLSRTHYPGWRRKQLIEGWDQSHRTLSMDDFRLDGFMKTETYMKFANPRGINSRSDNFKVAVGPLCKLMEDIVYHHYPEFIKSVPVRRRPQYILERLGHCRGPFYETDYTAFERHFTSELMDSCEMILYRRLLEHYPEEFNVLRAAMCGMNRIAYKGFTIVIRARRMSGEMVTSLGNGFTNLMLARFVAFKSRCTIEGVVEGDDGLFASNGDLDESLFEKLGFTIKIQRRESILESSFCGMMMSEDLVSFTEPLKCLANFGWSLSPHAFQSPRVRKQLLRAKGLSLLHEHPRCPMLAALAIRVIHLTEGVEARFEGGWYRAHLAMEIEDLRGETCRLASMGPSALARQTFADLYGVPIQAQLEFEQYISGWDGGPISHWVIDSMASEHPNGKDLAECWHEYVGTLAGLQ